MYETKPEPQRALLFTLVFPKDDQALTALATQELDSLVESIDVVPVSHETITVREINPATLIGKGKVAEISEEIDATGADLVIFNQAVKPRVQRNLEAAWGIPVIDREEVILRIFAARARTKEAKLQVELARLSYLRPRLAGREGQLSQQRGGGFSNRGQGETQLEIDQRRIAEKITKLQQRLQEVDKERAQQTRSRAQSPIPRIAIIGYTNSGKSTLLNHFSQGATLAEDKLFATLDPTTRLVKIPGGESFLLTDTVGFVSNLPTTLVDSFKSTLEEALDADLLILVSDALHPSMLACYQTTLQVLEELGAQDKPRILFINKMDKEHDEFSTIRLTSLETHVVTGSLLTGDGIPQLETEISDLLHELSPTWSCTIPEDRYDLVARLRREAQILSIEYSGTGVRATVRVRNPQLAQMLVPFLDHTV